MPQLRESFTFPLERNVTWRGSFATEPAEAAWANEAIFFVRVLESEGPLDGAVARAQLSPDGMHWCDEGTVFPLPYRRRRNGLLPPAPLRRLAAHLRRAAARRSAHGDRLPRAEGMSGAP